MENGKSVFSTHPNGVPLHRKQSSKWIPKSAPIYERVIDTTTISLRERFFKKSKERENDRCFRPNWMELDTPRYRLPNYKQYPTNKISTSKYTWLTFLPKNLWEQAQRYANIYFIIIAGMNWIPALKAFSKFLGMIPVIIILSMTALKDALEDWRRKRADYRLNHNTVHVWDATNKRFRKTLWELVIVGDLIHVSLNEKLPADIVLIRSSDDQGCVFVETANLDGENNLKQKVVVTKCKEFCLSDNFDPTDFHIRITCNPPDNRLNHIGGSVIYDSTGETDRISRENVILRGCQIRNTAFAEGIVIYTGKETKLMQSNGSIKYKRSSLERITNYFILCCVVLLIFIVVSSGICSMVWLKEYNAHEKNIPFVVVLTDSPINDGLINMAAYILIYQTLIPLALYLSIEIIKLGHNYLMSHDIEMYDEERDKKMICRTLNIPEELGQIKYVLSDKTGTLTENRMSFRSCAIEGEIFESEHKHRRCTLKAQNVTEITTESFSIRNGQAHIESSFFLQGSITKVPEDIPQISPKLQRELQNDIAQDLHSSRFYFLLNMCVCNTVMVRGEQKIDNVEMGYTENNVYNVGNSAFFVQVDPSQTPTNLTPPKTAELTPVSSFLARQFTFARPERLKRIWPRIFQNRHGMGKISLANQTGAIFDAESPDELALVKAADAYGFTLFSRSNNEIRVRFSNTSSPQTPTPTSISENELVLEVLQVLPFDSTRKRMSIVIRIGEKILLLCKGADEQVIPNLDPTQNDPELVTKTKHILENYGKVGLRTLCMAMRQIDEEEFNEWLETRKMVEAACSGDESDVLMIDTSKRLETNMKLLGCSAIEDRLQDGVTECIDDLRMAGIQVWVLTGDKCETAINIAKSCHLFNSNLQIVEFKSLEDVKQHSYSGVQINAVFSVDIIKLMKEGEPDVFRLIKRCAAIVCYRMTPAEKAEVVKAVKTRLKGKTLAIGDGANDVPMILSADVGVGISGREGLQAVMASDFAFSRFRFLKKLLLVHGHWNYYRLSNAILYFLEKNAVFVLVIFWEQFFNGFSSGFLIDPLYSMLYPVVFTSVQPVVCSIFDQNVRQDILLKYPSLYEQGREGQLCTKKAFALCMLDAFWQSAVLYFIPYLCFEESFLTFWQLGFVISTGVFFANSIHLAMLVRRWTTPLCIIFVLFALIHFLFFYIYTTIGSTYFGTIDPPLLVCISMTKMPLFWTCCLLSVTISLLPRAIIYLLWNRFCPDLCQKTIIEEQNQ